MSEQQQPSLFTLLASASQPSEASSWRAATLCEIKDAEAALQVRPIHCESAEWRQFCALLRSNYRALVSINANTLHQIAHTTVPTLCALFHFQKQSLALAFQSLAKSELESCHVH
jgi:hypothetical protein